MDDDIDLKVLVACFWLRIMLILGFCLPKSLLLAACFFFVFFIAVGFNNIYFIHVLGIYIFFSSFAKSIYFYILFI